MKKLAFLILFVACACLALASSNGGVRHLQPKRVPVILTNYADVTFKSDDYGAYKASLEKYFAENSFGQYTPVFDIIGPVTLDGNRRVYGENDEEGEDIAAEEMVAQACNKAEDLADFTIYDQDGDGRLDAVVIIYAGEGERMDNNLPDAVWEFTDDLETTYALDYLVQLDGKTVAACCAVPELQSKTKRDGIGTFIHEFAHILGLPNFCSTDGGVQKTLGDWSVMDHGCYNNEANTPAGFSAYECFYLGWVEPILLDEPMNVRLRDFRTTGDCAIITASGQSNLSGISPDPREFYILENRQQNGWDEYLPGHGLMLTKIDFVKNKWESDEVNNVENHPCVDLIEADGSAPKYKADNLTNGYFGKQKDLYPAGATSKNMFSNKMYFENVKEQNGVITFDFNGGVDKCTVNFSISNGTCSKQSATESKKGAGVVLPSVTPNNGFIFLGWSTRKNSTIADAGQPGDTFYPMSDCSVFAVMQDNTRFWFFYDIKGVTIGDYIGFNGAYVKKPVSNDIAVSFVKKTGYQQPTAANCLVKVECGGKQLANTTRFSGDSVYVTVPQADITGDIYVMVVNVREQKEDGCDNYSHTFTSKCYEGTAQDFSGYDWNVTVNNATTLDYDKNKGATFGSGTYPAGKVSLYTEETMGCAPAVIRVKAAANGDGVLSVFVAGNQVGEEELTTTLDEYVFEVAEPQSGAVEIRLENTNKAMYLKQIAIEFTKLEEPEGIENISVSEESNGRKILMDGQLYIIHNGRVYNIFGLKVTNNK